MKTRTRTSFSLLFLAVALTWATTAPARVASSPDRELRVTEMNLTRVTANVLEHSQFAHHPLDNDFAGKLLDRYLDALDPRRSLLLQSDVDEFARDRASLARAIREKGDTSTAHKIFSRYLTRLRQQADVVTTALRASNFDFTGTDTYSLDWEHASRPRDLAAAHALWKQQIRAEYLQEKLSDKKPEEIVKLLTRRHSQQLKTMAALTDDEFLETYLGTLAQVYDPHSNYLGHEEMENMSISMNLSLFGIGASLQTVDGYCTIHELLPGGPGARSGQLKPGDRIIAVTQAKGETVDVVDMPLTRTVSLIRGPKGTTVTLTVLPSGEGSVTKTVTLVRDRIRLEDQEAKAQVVDMPSGKGTFRLAVLNLPSFYADISGRRGEAQRSATVDVSRLLAKLKSEHTRGLILDLRHNGGGSLEEAITLTGLFIRKGPVVQTRDQVGNIEVDADDDPQVAFDGPLIVLTSRFSASASEILAGALQDYERAVLVGDTSTFGKGTVQSILPLSRLMDETGLRYAYDPGALLVTIRKFYRPSGASTQLRGVASDIVLPSLSDFSDVSESALHDPLPWDTIAPSSYQVLGRVKPYLATLREKSASRVKTDHGFALLAKGAARLKKTLDRKSVSLNEVERRGEIASSKKLQDELKQLGKETRASRPATYDITLANLSMPGLPARAEVPTDAATSASSDEDPTNLPGEITGHSLSDDVILNESLRVLQDYAQLLGR